MKKPRRWCARGFGERVMGRSPYLRRSPINLVTNLTLPNQWQGAQRHRKRFRGIYGQRRPERGAEWAIKRAVSSV